MKMDRLMLELLFEKKMKNAPKERKELTVKQMIKLMKTIPEFKRQFKDALKDLEAMDDKKEIKKDKLSLLQKYMLWTLAAFVIPPFYVALMGQLFAALKHNW